MREFLKEPTQANWVISINDKAEPKAPEAKKPGAQLEPRSRQWMYADATGQAIVMDAQPLTPSRIDALKAIGVTGVTMYKPGSFDLVCEELCGQGHYKMAGQIIVLSPEEYAEQFEAAPDTADAGEPKTTVTRK